jgi:competence protein ComEA
MLREIYEDYIVRYNKFIIIGSSLLFSIFILIFAYQKFLNMQQEINILKSNELLLTNVKEDKVEESQKYLFVDIKGAITNPGVYQVKENSRIADVIKTAGGLTKESDTSVLNLSKQVTDEMVIIIYTKEQIKKFREGNVTIKEVIKYIEKDCKCPDPSINKACINEDEKQEGNSNFLISINTATKEQLMNLPSIGESKALSIIDYRTKNGLFKDITDLKNVTGIGDSIFDKIKDLITL